MQLTENRALLRQLCDFLLYRTSEYVSVENRLLPCTAAILSELPEIYIFVSFLYFLRSHHAEHFFDRGDAIENFFHAIKKERDHSFLFGEIFDDFWRGIR